MGTQTIGEKGSRRQFGDAKAQVGDLFGLVFGGCKQVQNEWRIEWPQMLISAAANTLTLQRRQERGCVIRSQQQRPDENEHKSGS